ncbi:hypothetical protein JCM24511_02031 [Saitozyma sp. JCM 24511]|nr:hypothetical protein JCM24511_02031 [Saitozyma sp. JCM 24511]
MLGGILFDRPGLNDSLDRMVIRAHLLLLGDRNVQIRDVRALRGDDANILAIWSGDSEPTTVTKSELKSRNDGIPQLSLLQDGKEQQGLQQTMPSQVTDRSDGVLQQARKYRNTFAEILVVGALLQDLQGEGLGILERWTGWERVREEEIRWGEKPKDVEG